MIERIVDSSPFPCEIYHEVVDTVLYRSGVKRQMDYHHEEGAGICTVIEGIMGIASTNTMKNLEVAYNLSRSFAQHGSRTRELPQPSSPAIAVSCFDPCIAEASQEDILALAEDVLTDIPSSCTVIDEVILLKTQKVHIVNSNGVDVTKKGTAAVLDVVLQDKRVDSSFYSCFYSRTWDLSWSLSEEVEQWRRIKDKSDTEPGEHEVIFSPIALSKILDSVFVPVICGEVPQAGEILSKESKIAPDIDVYDHGTLEGGMGSEPFDGEGVPQQKTPLLIKGRFHSILYDTTHAAVNNMRSTGNAVRESFAHVPQVYITNLFVSPLVTAEELVDEVKEGIWIGDLLGAHITHAPSGDFVCSTQNSYRIHKGEIVGSVPPKTIEGTIFSLLRDFTPGNDIKRIDRYVVPSARARLRVY